MTAAASDIFLQKLAQRVESELEARLSQSRTAERLKEAIKNANLIADEQIARIQDAVSENAARGKGRRLDCKAGCAWCCHGLVLATIPEALTIHEHVSQHFSQEENQELDVRVDKYVEESRSLSNLSNSRAACPFLKDNLCTIYEIRPLTCRGVNSTNVQSCIDIYSHPAAAKPRARVTAQDEIADAIIFGERTALFFENLDHRMVDLGKAMQMFRESSTPIDSYLNGRYEMADAKLAFPNDPLLIPEIQKHLRPAYKTDQEGNEPVGEPSRVDLAFVTDFWNKFGKGDYGPAFKSLKGASAAELIAKMQVPSAYESEEEIQHWRDRAIAAQREFAASNVSPENAFDALAMHVPLRLAYQGLQDKDMMKEHNEILFSKIHAKLWPDLVVPIDRKPSKGRKIRVGYVSQHIRYNNGARWALGWIQNHSEDIESFVFNVGYDEDPISRRFQRDADHYFFLTRGIPENARFIKSLNLDVLIFPDAQAAGRNTQYSLFRLAPVQCCAWGSPVTTGAPTIDYYISSELMEPMNAQDQYNEKLVLLPNSGLCYPRFTNDPISNRSKSDYGLAADKPFLYLAQATMKCLPQFDHVYKEISDRLDAPIVIHESKSAATKIVKRRLEKAGVRTHWLPFVGRGDFLRLMQLCDVSLDTPMWSGGNTTIEALTFGKPVVTLPGAYMRSRHSYAFLKIAGADGLIAKNAEDYVSLATSQDRQQAALANLNPDALFEDKSCGNSLDNFLRSVSS